VSSCDSLAGSNAYSLTYPDNLRAYWCTELSTASAERRAQIRAQLAWPVATYAAIAVAKCTDEKWSSGGSERLAKRLGLSSDSALSLLAAGTWVWTCPSA
jgi:hypothetical protein